MEGILFELERSLFETYHKLYTSLLSVCHNLQTYFHYRGHHNQESNPHYENQYMDCAKINSILPGYEFLCKDKLVSCVLPNLQP